MHYVVGELAALGLRSRSMAAVTVIDTMQFAVEPEHVVGELARVVRDGGVMLAVGRADAVAATQ